MNESRQVAGGRLRFCGAAAVDARDALRHRTLSWLKRTGPHRLRPAVTSSDSLRNRHDARVPPPGQPVASVSIASRRRTMELIRLRCPRF